MVTKAQLVLSGWRLQSGCCQVKTGSQRTAAKKHLWLLWLLPQSPAYPQFAWKIPTCLQSLANQPLRSPKNWKNLNQKREIFAFKVKVVAHHETTIFQRVRLLLLRQMVILSGLCHTFHNFPSIATSTRLLYKIYATSIFFLPTLTKCLVI